MNFTAELDKNNLNILFEDETISNVYCHQKLLACIRETDHEKIVFDMKKVKYCGSAVTIISAIKSTDKKVIIRNVNEDLHLLFEIVGLSKIIEVYNN